VTKSIALNSFADLASLKEIIAGKKVVMLGEASHGTHEYYTWRTAISKMLIEEHGFSFIAVEGDWPDCYRINSYVKSEGNEDEKIEDILRSLDRWPTWMWANWEIVALAEWLKEFNAKRSYENKAGFYGLDVYSLWDSMMVMVEYLEKEDPRTAETVKKAIRCFEPYKEEGQNYAMAVSRMSTSCRDEVLQLLKEVRRKSIHYDHDPEAGMNAEQNARIAVNAEKYYSSMLGFNNASWNVRDHHMMETLEQLLNFHGEDSKAIVWEHNTHIGDARFTDMKDDGMINIGQLAREKYGDEKVVLIGFGSYKGMVIAGKAWGEWMQRMQVPPAKPGSLEHFLHEEYHGNRLLIFNKDDKEDPFDASFDHRAIGVVYNPAHERYGNYVPSIISSRYDAFIFLDETKALHPMHLVPDGSKMPETYPFGT
jgi:erythromycin esterase